MPIDYAHLIWNAVFWIALIETRQTLVRLQICLYMELKVRSHSICNLPLIRNSICIKIKYYFFKKKYKNFTILNNWTCKFKLKLFIALTSKILSFTCNLFLHHCYHHKTLSYSHLLFSLVFSCIIFTLTVICVGQDDLCMQHTGIYLNKSHLPVHMGTSW